MSKFRLEHENAFPARVDEEFFKGAMVRCVLATDAGTRLNAMMPNEGARRDAIRVGDRVWCSVQVDDIVVLPGNAVR